MVGCFSQTCLDESESVAVDGAVRPHLNSKYSPQLALRLLKPMGLVLSWQLFSAVGVGCWVLHVAQPVFWVLATNNVLVVANVVETMTFCVLHALYGEKVETHSD